MGDPRLVMLLFFLLGYVTLSVLTVVLPVITGRLCWKKWKGRGQRREETGG